MLPPKNKIESTTIAADTMRNFKSIAASANISMRQVLADLNIDTATLDGKEQLSLIDIFRIQEHLSLEVKDESLLMRDRPLLLGTNDHVLASLEGKKTLIEAMKQLALSYNFIHGGNYNRVESQGKYLVYIIDDADFPYSEAVDNQYIAFNMLNIVIFVHAIISTVCEVSIAHAFKKIQCKPCRAIANLEQTLLQNVIIDRNATRYALYDDISIAQLGLDSTNGPLTSHAVYREIHAMLSVQNQAKPHLEDVKAQVLNALESGIRHQDKVASHLHCSVATLRRNLSQQNTSFRALKEMVLSQDAKVLLAQQHPLSDIAEQLGFSDVRSFIRAFKHWYGVTPSDYCNRPE